MLCAAAARRRARYRLSLGIDYLRNYPSTIGEGEPDDLFAPAEDECPLETWLAQWGWMSTLGRAGGLFVTVGRKPELTLAGA